MTSIKKKALSFLMSAIMLLTCFSTTAFAAEPSSNTVSQETSLAETISNRATVPGTVVASATAKFTYSGQVTLTVPSGSSAQVVGIIIADRTTGTAASGTFKVSPAFNNVSTISGSSSMQYFSLYGNGIIGQRTVTYTFEVDSAPWTHEYEVAVILYHVV